MYTQVKSETLMRIGKLGLYLEGKGRSKSTQLALRQAYVTNKLHKIQNAEFVRKIIGHERLDTTQKYFHLLDNTNGEWIVEGTSDKERAHSPTNENYSTV